MAERGSRGTSKSRRFTASDEPSTFPWLALASAFVQWMRGDTLLRSRRRGASDELLAFQVLFGFLLMTALWWGAAQRGAVIVTSGLLLITTLMGWRTLRAPSLLVWPLLACGSWTLLALVPMPMSLLDAISPRASELWAGSMHLFAASAPRWATVSIDPGATWLEALKWVAYALVAWSSATLTQSRGFNAVLGSVFLVAVFLAMASLTVAAFQGDLAWLAGGSHRETTRVSSFLINPNNLAGYLNLGGFCGLGLVASRRPPVSRTVLALGGCVVLASSVWSGSRAGVAVLVVSSLVLVSWWAPRLLREQRYATQAKVGLAALLGIGAPGLAWLGASSGLYRELLSDDLSKFGLLPSVVPAARDYWLMGTGRGGFESVAQLYLPSSSNVVFRYVENFVMSWVVEWGAPFSAALVCALSFVLRPKFLRLRRGAPAQAAYLGVLAVIVQNFMDLGLELFSLTSAVVAVLAALVASRNERGGRDEFATTHRSKSVAVTLGALMVLCLVGAAVTGPDAYKARKLLEERWAQSSHTAATLPELLPHLRREVLRRPADPYPFIIGAVAAWEGKHRILPWAAEAVERAPTNGRAHFLVGLGLSQLGAARQALFHLVQTVRFNPQLISRAASAASQLSSEPQFFVQGVSATQAGSQLLVAIASQWTDRSRRAGRRALVERAVAIAPESSRALAMLANDRLQEIIDTKSTCRTKPSLACEQLAETLQSDLKRIEEMADRLIKLDQCEGIRIKARRFEVSEETSRALAVLDGCNACQSPAACLRTAASIAQNADDATRTTLEQQYIAASCDNSESCGRAEFTVGQLAERRGDWWKAHMQYSRAAALGQNGDYWMAAARAAVRAGRAGDAERAYRQAESLGMKDATVRSALDQLKKDALPRLLAQ